MNKIMTDNECWALVSEFGWGIKDCDVERISAELQTKLSSEKQVFFMNWVRDKSQVLYKILRQFADKQPETFRRYYSLSDDSFGDMVDHIVGLGKDVYQKTCKDPLLAKARALKRDFKENFQYIFCYLWERD